MSPYTDVFDIENHPVTFLGRLKKQKWYYLTWSPILALNALFLNILASKRRFTTNIFQRTYYIVTQKMVPKEDVNTPLGTEMVAQLEQRSILR